MILKLQRITGYEKTGLSLSACRRVRVRCGVCAREEAGEYGTALGWDWGACAARDLAAHGSRRNAEGSTKKFTGSSR